MKLAGGSKGRPKEKIYGPREAIYTGRSCDSRTEFSIESSQNSLKEKVQVVSSPHFYVFN